MAAARCVARRCAAGGHRARGDNRRRRARARRDEARIATPLKPLNVGLLGFGTAGRGTFYAPARNAGEIARRAGRPIEVSAIATRSPEPRPAQRHAVGLGPGGGDESPNTLDHLAAEGFDYVCDWGFDDQPCAMRVKSGRMIAIPYQQGLNDIRVIFQGGHTPKDWLQMVCDQFDTLYAEGATQGRVMTIPLHPFVIGLAFRIKYLHQAFNILRARRRMESDGCRDRRLLLCQ